MDEKGKEGQERGLPFPDVSLTLASLSPSPLPQVELSRWVGIEALRGSLFGKMRDAMKEDVERAVAALQV
jgi:hypothetical protein